MFKDDISVADLLFQNRLLRERIADFENGTKYKRMTEECNRIHRADTRTIEQLRKELAAERAETIRVRELWYGTCADVMKEKEKALAEKDREISRLKKQLLMADGRNKKEHEKYLEKLGELYEIKTQLEDEKEKNRSLNARLHKDYSNSSKPSSMAPSHKTIHNSRKKTGRKPGGQPGHIHYGRKPGIPTRKEKIPTPEEYKDESRYKATGRQVTKQLIKMRFAVEVIEYAADEYRNNLTGQRVHAAFPDGLVDDVTYDGTVKAAAYLINNSLYTSVEKTAEFIREITHGQVSLSSGFVCGLAKEFSKKTEKERDGIFLKLMAAPVLHSDFTFGRAAGKQTAVAVTATDDMVMYQGRRKKGDEGIKGTPVEFYEGTLVSDHEAAIIKHGKKHQECLAHLLRYAKSGKENEPEKTWHDSLIGWIGRATGYWNEVHAGNKKYETGTASAYIEELREILDRGKKEYEYEPPTKYFRDGINTCSRMAEKIEDYVLFLRDPDVPPTNNVAERAGRKYKRKAHQVMSFKSDEGSDLFCDGLTVMESVRAKGENLYDAVVERFNQDRG